MNEITTETDFLKLIEDKRHHSITGYCFVGFDLKFCNLFSRDFEDCVFRDVNVSSSKIESCNFTNCYFSSITTKYCHFSNLTIDETVNYYHSSLYDTFECVKADNKNSIEQSDYVSSMFSYCFFRNINISNNEFSYCTFIKLPDGKDYEKILEASILHCYGLYSSCPEEGSFIGYKKILHTPNEKEALVKLLILEDSKRSSSGSGKCRASKVQVLSITDIDSGDELTCGRSIYNSDFIYEVGQIIEINDFDENKWEECSTGIHFFVDKREALGYEF